MSTSVIILGLLIAGLIVFLVGMARARAANKSSGEPLHSRPGYHGAYLLIWTVLPALLVTLLWAAAEPTVVRQLVTSALPDNVKSLSPAEQSLVVGKINSVARGLPSLSREELEIIKRARYGFATTADAQRVLQERGVALGSAPEPFVITAAYDQLFYQTWSRWMAAGTAAFLAFGCFLYSCLLYTSDAADE